VSQKEKQVSKVFGMHVIALKPGISPEAFETFIQDEFYALAPLAGTEVYVLRADRGDREGRYLAMLEFDSAETRNRHFPAPGELSEEVQRTYASWAGTLEKWAKFATPIDVISTDYKVIGK
jgi:hypothetical protein